jgi:hypothetical protein
MIPMLLIRPYDCAKWRVQVKKDGKTLIPHFSTWKEPVGRLEG